MEWYTEGEEDSEQNFENTTTRAGMRGRETTDFMLLGLGYVHFWVIISVTVAL